MTNLFDDLIIFEMANNHQGDVKHALSIIKEMSKISKKYKINSAVKFQYRHLDTFIHPKHRQDKEAKHISRFLSTELKPDQFKTLVKALQDEGMKAICTPFDERSVDLIVDHDIEIIKVASCSADDWPLLEKIASADKPVISSTAGLDISAIDNLVNFLKHRNKEFAIMHCVGIYPSPNELLNMKFLSKLIKRYSDVPVGYSGHESPGNIQVVTAAVALGASLFERHVGLPTDKIQLNKYSMNPQETEEWVKALLEAKAIIGSEDKTITATERDSLLSLKRGVFVNKKIKKGRAITNDDVYFAMPCAPDQLNSAEFGRVRARYVATSDYDKDAPVFEKNEIDSYYKLRKIIHEAKGILNEAGIILNENAEIELSHHYGIENFYKFGGLIVSLINREYCKKIIVVFSGQHHPEQRHVKKEETFHLLSGDLVITLNGITSRLKAGDIVTIERGVTHSFYSENGAVFEEVSTTHYRNDSFYTDPLIAEEDPMARKTIIKAF